MFVITITLEIETLESFYPPGQPLDRLFVHVASV